MQTPTASILNSIDNKNRPLNILTSPTHERYESNLAKTGHNFYSLKHPKLKDWVNDHAVKPDNYHIYTVMDNINHVDFDLVLSQSKFGQYQFLAPLSKQMGLPLITLEHTTVLDKFWDNQKIQTLSTMGGDLNVFIAKYQIEKWGFRGHNNTIINHTVDVDIFKSQNVERKNHILSVVNDWINRKNILGLELWNNVTNGLPRHVRGDTAGLSTKCETIEELVNEYSSSRIFLNTSEYSPIPTVLLEAMACECAVVSTDNCAISEYIEHGVNGFISNNPQEIKKYLNLLLKDEDLAVELGKNARETIIKKCSQSRFLKEWNDAFKSVLIT